MQSRAVGRILSPFRTCIFALSDACRFALSTCDIALSDVSDGYYRASGRVFSRFRAVSITLSGGRYRALRRVLSRFWTCIIARSEVYYRAFGCLLWRFRTLAFARFGHKYLWAFGRVFLAFGLALARIERFRTSFCARSTCDCTISDM